MKNFRNDIIPSVDSINGPVNTSVDGGTTIINGQEVASTESGTTLLNDILKFVQDSIFSLLAVIAIGAFLYIGFMFVKADGNPEEMKKAFMSLVHVIIGLFVVAISWIVVKMVSGINF